MIHNVMLNLLSNAIKYSDEDIRVQIRVDDQNIYISVADQGVGIPEAEQPSLFSKYFRASNVGSIKGTGLGLNIVRRYIELLNGTIHFSSNPKDGTTFYVHLPNNSIAAA
jgi:signal transduction histidine kinase